MTPIWSHTNRQARSRRDLQRSSSSQAELKPSRYLKPLTNFKLRPSGKLCKDLPWVGDSISLCLSAVISFPLCRHDNPHCPVLERRTTRLSSSKNPARHLPSRKQTKARLTEHTPKVCWCGRFFLRNSLRCLEVCYLLSCQRRCVLGCVHQRLSHTSSWEQSYTRCQSSLSEPNNAGGGSWMQSPG